MEYPGGYYGLTITYPPGYLCALDDSKEKTVVIPVDTPEIDIDRLAEAVGAKATIIDVREPCESVAGYGPGAALIPMDQLPGRTAELDNGAPA